jgi:hypothetical protein
MLICPHCKRELNRENTEAEKSYFVIPIYPLLRVEICKFCSERVLEERGEFIPLSLQLAEVQRAHCRLYSKHLSPKEREDFENDIATLSNEAALEEMMSGPELFRAPGERKAWISTRSRYIDRGKGRGRGEIVIELVFWTRELPNREWAGWVNT